MERICGQFQGDTRSGGLFDHIVSKPQSETRALQFRAAATVCSIAPIWERGPVKKVLVVDDSETIRLEVGRNLGQAGFSVLEARDGAEGLHVASTHLDLSLIVLDVNMPVMNGLDMLDRLKREAKTQPIPVLLLTTEAQDTLIDRAKKAGAKGWLIKPVKSEILLMAAKKLAR
jgi:two-component system chemotaxis response regulator CheY